MILRAGAAGLIRQNRAVMARADLRPALPALACATLVVGGLDDQLTRPVARARSPRRFPLRNWNCWPIAGTC